MDTEDESREDNLIEEEGSECRGYLNREGIWKVRLYMCVWWYVVCVGR